MKKKKQIIKDLNTTVIPSNWESAESYAVKKLAKIFVGICILALITLAFFMIKDRTVKPQEQPAVVQTPKVPIITLENQTYLIIDGVAVLNVSKKDWTRLTNAYPHNIKTGSITFSK